MESLVLAVIVALIGHGLVVRLCVMDVVQQGMASAEYLEFRTRLARFA